MVTKTINDNYSMNEEYIKECRCGFEKYYNTLQKSCTSCFERDVLRKNINTLWRTYMLEALNFDFNLPLDTLTDYCKWSK